MRRNSSAVALAVTVTGTKATWTSQPDNYEDEINAADSRLQVALDMLRLSDVEGWMEELE